MTNISQKSHTTSPKIIDSLWIKEIQRRKQEIDSGKVIPIEGREVFRKIKHKYNTKP